MKMSRWVAEDDHVRLKGDSSVKIVSQLLKGFSATGVVPFPYDEFHDLIKAFCHGDINYIQKLLKSSHMPPDGKVYSESGSSFHLCEVFNIAQQIDIIKLLLTDYSMDPTTV